MLCIAAFIIFSILGIFSASYRKLAKKGWYCVARKLTFRPCDINFSEELKGKMLGKLIFTHPRLAKFLSRFANVLAFIFVALTIWSTLYVAQAGLNLWVYDTCTPTQAESCSLGGAACGIDSLTATDEFSLWNTIARIPERWKNWQPQDYLPPVPSYFGGFQKDKPTALEMIDPSCRFCKQLWHNIEESHFTDKYNLVYVLYPIKGLGDEYKFPYSYLLASYLEAIKNIPLNTPASISPDWQLLQKLFATGPSGQSPQEVINASKDKQVVIDMIHQFLKEIGYTPEQIKTIDQGMASETVKTALEKQRDIVEKQIKTVKIPTILFGGRRFDRVVEPSGLR